MFRFHCTGMRVRAKFLRSVWKPVVRFVFSPCCYSKGILISFFIVTVKYLKLGTSNEKRFMSAQFWKPWAQTAWYRFWWGPHPDCITLRWMASWLEHLQEEKITSLSPCCPLCLPSPFSLSLFPPLTVDVLSNLLHSQLILSKYMSSCSQLADQQHSTLELWWAVSELVGPVTGESLHSFSKRKLRKVWDVCICMRLCNWFWSAAFRWLRLLLDNSGL